MDCGSGLVVGEVHLVPSSPSSIPPEPHFFPHQIFDNRLKCNNECKKMEDGSEEKKTCEEKFCKEVPVERRKEDADDDDDDAPVTRKKENLTKKKKDETAEDSFEAFMEEEEEKAKVKANELATDE